MEKSSNSSPKVAVANVLNVTELVCGVRVYVYSVQAVGASPPSRKSSGTPYLIGASNPELALRAQNVIVYFLEGTRFVISCCTPLENTSSVYGHALCERNVTRQGVRLSVYNQHQAVSALSQDSRPMTREGIATTHAVEEAKRFASVKPRPRL